MKKNCLKKYSVILIVLVILYSLLNFFSVSRNLLKWHNQEIEIELWVTNVESSCYFSLVNGLHFRLDDCHGLIKGEKYRLFGRVIAISDNKFMWQNNFDVKAITPVLVNFKSGINWFEIIVNNWLLFVENQQDFLLRMINTYFNGDNRQFLTALTLGTRVFDFDQDLKDSFSLAGLSHMVAVSGFHLSVVFSLLGLVLSKFFTQKVAKFFLFLIGFFYVFLVGSSMSVLRAFLMVLISLIGRVFLKKQTSGLLALFGTFIFMFNFLILSIFNVGFILSFLATFGILYFGGIFGKLSDIDFANFSSGKAFIGPKMVFFKLWDYIKGIVTISLAAQIFTLPVLVVFFETYSVWSIPSTILFSSLIVLLVFLGVIFAISCYFVLLGNFFVWILVEPLALFCQVVSTFFSQSFAFYSQKIGDLLVISKDVFSLPVVVIYYSFFFLFGFLLKKLFIKRKIYEI